MPSPHRTRCGTNGPTEGNVAVTKEPTFRATAFTCPACQALAHHRWWAPQGFHPLDSGGGMVLGEMTKRLVVSICQHCTGYCLWVNGSLVYPSTSTAPMPVADTPDDVKDDFLEARTVFDRSPRSAAALLRLALQKLLLHLGEKGKDIHTDIKSLVSKGLPVQVQQALDAVRVIGNSAVHPGRIDLNDKKETAAALFGLLNFIVERMITQPKEIDTIYDSLPQSARDAIEKRDGK